MRVADVGLYARTATQLRPGQIAHAIFRRFVPQSRPRAPTDGVRLRTRKRLPPSPPANHAFWPAPNAEIVWNDPTLPRLWRYHLHYFDLLNDSRRTADAKTAAMLDWIAHNPMGTPDAWDPYPLSLRIVNWVAYLDASGEADESIRASLYAQTLWLERNLEHRLLANHLLKNAKALLFAGAFFEGTDAERWLARGRELFRAQVREQFLADGGHYERSPMYHAISLADVLDAIVMLESVPGASPPGACRDLRDAARRALAFYAGILMPDGEIPLFNDAAFGVGPRVDDLLAYGAATIGARVARVARDDGARLQSFPDSGYYTIRNGGDMLAIDCGELGPVYQPGHAHADALSFELALAGRRVVVDTGVNAYEAGAARTYARSTAAHNTVTVDGRDQSEMWSAFRVARRARPIAASLEYTQAGARFRGRLRSRGTEHERTVTYARGLFTFEDRVRGHGTHDVRSFVHLAPDLEPVWTDGAIVLADRADRTPVARIVVSPGVACVIENAPYFPGFGATVESRVVVLSVRGRSPLAIGYAIERV